MYTQKIWVIFKESDSVKLNVLCMVLIVCVPLKGGQDGE